MADELTQLVREHAGPVLRQAIGEALRRARRR
jgi:hypothetical protein